MSPLHTTLPPQPVEAAAKPDILTTTDLSVSIGGVRILKDITLTVRQGEILVILGPNGAGKTTMFNVLSGLRAPTAGTISLEGQDITRQPIHTRARNGISRSFQITSLFPQLTVLENVRLAAQAHLGGSLALWRLVNKRDKAIKKAHEALATVGIEHRAEHIAADLSHGDKRKLEVAVAIASDPKVLLLDEPTAGMSAENVPELTDVIARLSRDRGTTVVLIEHRMDVSIALADRMAVMHHGVLLACDTPERVMVDPLVQSAYLGEAL